MDAFNQSRWSLQDLLPESDGPSLLSYLAELEACAGALEAARQYLSPDISSTEFLDLLGQYEALSKISSRLGAYAYLWFSEDTQNPAALNLRGRIDQALTQAGNRILFFSLWFKDLEDETARRLMDASGDLRYFLDGMRRFKSHTLSEAEERIINMKDVDGIDALVEMYDLITNRLSFILEVDGQTKTLTRDQLTAYFRHPSAQVREATYRELFRVFGENSTLLSQIYLHRVRDWHTEALELRGYDQPISYRNLVNDIPDPVIDTLLEVCRGNAGIFQRYFRLKAGWLGMEKLRRCDIYAPLAQSEKTFEFSQAVELVLNSFRDFSPLAAEQAERVFRANHLDSENRPGKRGGAFCYAALPDLTPWVLVNYAGRARDVATLAHELGHAIHGGLSSHQSILNYRPSLPLAETASVFAEMLLTERLLSEESDPALRRDLLAHAIDDAYATVLRQAFFTLFEREAHRMIVDGRSTEELCEHYLENLAVQFGESVELTEEFKWEWISIPHLYKSPFYTYSYSFGQLLVLALFQQYKMQGSAFIPRYLKILSYGGSAAPQDILAEAGINMAEPAFWQGGFDMLAGMIRQLEEM